MVLYLITIFICMAIISVLDIIFCCPIFGFSWWYPILCVTFCTIVAIIIDAIVAIVVRNSPKKWFNPFRKRYNVGKWEKTFFEKIGIRFWKDKIPETGGLLVGFRKDVAGDITNNEHVFKFMEETCYAEIMHLYSAFFGFLVMLVCPLKYCLIFGLPVGCVNFVLQILPIFVQRYTRPKLKKAYERNAKRLNKV